MYRDREEDRVQFKKEFEHVNLERFINRYLVPDIFYFSETHDIIAFVHTHPVVVLIRNIDEPEQRRVEEQFKEVAFRI